MVRLNLGYPDRADEAEMLDEQAGGDRVLELEPVAGVATVLDAQAAVRQVHASEELRRYVVRLAELTRSDSRVVLGASPRAGLQLFLAARALAALAGRDHVLPDDVQALATSVLAHRILLAPGHADEERAAVIDDALDRLPAL
jgi:MoxR-like ATPase